MGSGRRQRATVEDPSWVPTPKHACLETSDTLLLNPWDADGETVWLFFGLWHYRHRLMHFCVELSIRDEGGQNLRKVERVDTCHGVVHRHRFRSSGAPDDNVGSTNHLYALAPNMHNELGASYDEHFERLSSQWPQLIERWRSS